MRIAIVNDSPIAIRAMEHALYGAKMKVAWVAQDGMEAIEKYRVDPPDIILMDLIMPQLDGVETTRRIMKERPCPILIVTSSVDTNVAQVFAAMGAGAMDAVSTPPFNEKKAQDLLLDKIRSLAAICNLSVTKNFFSSSSPLLSGLAPCVLIGSSAGGPAALMEIIPQLPENLASSVIIVQHVDVRFAGELAGWLNERSALPVRLAEEGDEPHAGEVLISQGGHHLTFSRGKVLHYTDLPQLSYQPSIDVFFESTLKYGPDQILAMILTGMGRDGAVGLKKLRDAGKPTIAQDEASSAIYGMPKAARDLGAAREILPLSVMAKRIVEWSASLKQ